MARRSFIKACNDMVSSSGQPNVGGLNISEISNNGMGHHPKEVDAVSRQKVKVHNKENGSKSRYAVSPLTPSNKPPLTENVHTGVRWNGISKKDRNMFIDIDGDRLPGGRPEELNGEENKVIDTSHKIQRHISLVDLARPYVPRAPNNNPRMMQENREKKKLVKNEEPIKDNTLPKGISETDQPYILPKFTPSFREMISSSKGKKDTLVSLTEPTPPSLQKWALEWNSEPRHSISIAELEEDIIREKAQKYTKSSVEEEPPSFNRASPKYNETPTETVPMSSHQAGRTQNNLVKAKASPKTVYAYLNEGESIDTHIEPDKYEEMLEAMETNPPTIEVGSKPSVDWLQGNNDRWSFKRSQLAKYSFTDTIRENENEHHLKKSIQQNAMARLQVGEEEEFSLEEDMQKFHKWFRNRLTSADKGDKDGKNTLARVDGKNSNPFYAAGSDALVSETYSRGDPMRTQIEEKEKMKIPESSNSNMSRHHPPKNGAIEPPAEQFPPEKNSSFYHWLKQRGLMSALMASGTIAAYKPAKTKENLAPKVEKVVKPEQKFPWSTSYTCKYVTDSNANKKEKNEPTKDSKPLGKKSLRAPNNRDSKYFKPVTTQNFRGTVPLKKAAPQTALQKMKHFHKNAKLRDTNYKIEANKSNVEIEKILARKNSPDIFDRNEAKRPYFGWAVDSELDHVKNMRYMENNHAAPQVMNRKKLFPTLYDQISSSPMNYWESKYARPLGDDFYLNLERVDVSGTGENKKKSGSLIDVAPMSNIFYDRNFINISDDPVRINGADDDESLISWDAPEQIGEKLFTGNHTLKANHSGASKTLKGDSPINLKFSRILDPKPDEGLATLKDSSEIHGEGKCSVQGLEANRNEVDEEWTQVISPKGFNLNNDGDLIHLLSNTESKPSFASPKLS